MIPPLEKLKAALGAAGMAAVGLEALGLGRSVGGGILLASGAALSALAAAYVTDVSTREAELGAQVGRESAGADATGA